MPARRQGRGPPNRRRTCVAFELLASRCESCRRTLQAGRRGRSGQTDKRKRAAVPVDSRLKRAAELWPIDGDQLARSYRKSRAASRALQTVGKKSRSHPLREMSCHAAKLDGLYGFVIIGVKGGFWLAGLNGCCWLKILLRFRSSSKSLRPWPLINRSRFKLPSRF